MNTKHPKPQGQAPASKFMPAIPGHTGRSPANQRILWLAAAVLVTTATAHGQLLSVDINKSQAPRSDDTAPGFAGWYDVGTGQQATHLFTNYTVVFDAEGFPLATNISSVVSCALRQTFPPFGSAGSSLITDWQAKKGNSTSPDPNAGFRLAEDGVWVNNSSFNQPYTNGGALSLAVSNLAAGVHTIATYHNCIWGTNSAYFAGSSGVLSRCIISANGVPVFTNVPSQLVTNDFKCGFAFFSITNAYDGEPVVLNFEPDHSSDLDFVVLNGFQIDRPNAPGTTATAIFPAPADEHVFAHADVPNPGTSSSGFLSLQWVPASFALSNYVYFGTNAGAVAGATIGSPEFKGALVAVTGVTNAFGVSNLNSGLTYYWRVDQLNAENGGTNLAVGPVWKFRTRHLAFPGAEGYGRFARGGRGGIVLEVTNLLDYDSSNGEAPIPGSYRAAIEASGARTVVFRVSGLIRLKRPCTINSANGHVTIAGQTAPGEGICLANWRAGLSGCSDVIMRFIRCRLGDASQQAMDGIGLGNSTHSIIDHCSISWTIDEASSSRQSGAVGSESAMTTFQRNLISEPLQHSYHYNDALRAATGCTNCFQPHGYAASISGEIGSYHHNLIAHSTDRNWSLAGGLDQTVHYAGSLDIRNNVVYNWLGRTTDGGVARCNYVSNYYKPYPANPCATWLLKLDTLNTNWGTEAYFMAGNVMEGRDYYANNWLNGGFYNGPTVQAQVQTNAEIFPSYVTSQTASNAFKLVLSDVGCNLPEPDVIDRRVIGEVLDGTTHYIGTNGPNYTINGVLQEARSPNYPGIIDSPTDVRDALDSPNSPWPAYRTRDVPQDSDHDGLPDWWELLKGLNPQSPPGDFSDSNADPDEDGYSNLEDYLNWLAAPHLKAARNASADVDLTQFARGFTNNSPVFSVFNPTNGTVALLPNAPVARFTPAPDFFGLASFQFGVVDAQGATLTNRIGLHVRALPESQLGCTLRDGAPELQFSGETGFYYLLEYSDDLWDWITWTNARATTLPLIFSPPGFPQSAARFYRAVSVQ